MLHGWVRDFITIVRQLRTYIDRQSAEQGTFAFCAKTSIRCILLVTMLGLSGHNFSAVTLELLG